MKKLYTLFTITALLNTLAFAQSFVLTPTDNYETSIELNSYTNHQVNIVNQTGAEIILGWETVYNDMPERWEITLCDYGGCNIGIPDSGLMYPISDTISAYLRLTINPYDLIATGAVTFKVFDTKHPEQFQMVMFTIHSGNVTGILPVASASSFSVFPNPASEEITITNFDITAGTISLVNLHGQVVRQSIISNNQESYNINELQKGLYVIMISDKSGILEQKKIMIQ